jgi:hypothetical protein
MKLSRTIAPEFIAEIRRVAHLAMVWVASNEQVPPCWDYALSTAWTIGEPSALFFIARCTILSISEVDGIACVAFPLLDAFIIATTSFHGFSRTKILRLAPHGAPPC